MNSKEIWKDKKKKPFKVLPFYKKTKITLFVFEAKTVTFIISLRISFLFFTIKAKPNLHGHRG